MKPSNAFPPIAGLCVGCQKPTNEMPLCVQCCDVWLHDLDTWDDNSAWAQDVRAKANTWRRAHGANV